MHPVDLLVVIWVELMASSRDDFFFYGKMMNNSGFGVRSTCASRMERTVILPTGYQWIFDQDEMNQEDMGSLPQRKLGLVLNHEVMVHSYNVIHNS